ncbi:MAG TPA: ferritin family protein [Streptosporangiaceae bacterium]|nr:ferritin family protein [Streptosporangiaceae bacterium]
MGPWSITRYAVVALAAAVLAAQSQAAAADEVHPSTRANALEAMHGEAFANVAYGAYAAQAVRERLPRAAWVFRWAASVELREHFTEEAELIHLVRGDAANLRTAIAGETEEATHMYPRFAAEARADHDFAAARLFSEIAADEAAHARDFAKALAAITRPSQHLAVPAGPTARPRSIRPGGPLVSSDRTLRNLRTAMRGEAFASAAYVRYAGHARAEGHPRVATLFLRTALVERTEHFAEEAILAGLVGDTRANLRTAIAGETEEATRMYPRFGGEARAVGDLDAARLFTEIAHDEAGHARAFHRVLVGPR